MERWRTVEGYPAYDVSDLGRVRSRRAGVERLLKPYADTFGHLQVKLYNSPTDRRQRLVHVLVMEAFVGPRSAPEIDTRHIDGDPTNNVLSNLAYGTHAQNARDMVEHGRGWAGHTHCINGHPFDATNTYFPPGRPGHRGCRTCRSAAEIRYRQRRQLVSTASERG